MKVDLCDLRRLLRADFFAKDRDVTLQSGRSYYSGGGELAGLPDGAIVLMFSGAVVDIPTGWQLADGTNGTSDMVDMFVVGAGNTYNPGDTGGATTHTHGPGTLNTDNDTHNHGPGTLNTDNDTHDHGVDSGSSGGGTNHTHGAGTLTTGNNSTSSIVEGFAFTEPVSVAGHTHTHDVTSGATAIETSHTHGSGSYNTDNDTHDHDVNSGVTADDTHDHDVNSGVTASTNGLPPYYALCFIMRPT